MTTTDFEIWLNSIEPNIHEVYNLYQAVKERDLNTFNPRDNISSDHTPFSIIKGKEEGKYFIRCSYFDDTLMLASEKAVKAFLNLLESTYCQGMDIESWYGYQCALENSK